MGFLDAFKAALTLSLVLGETNWGSRAALAITPILQKSPAEAGLRNPTVRKTSNQRAKETSAIVN
jgi:hypothetical protein